MDAMTFPKRCLCCQRVIDDGWTDAGRMFNEVWKRWMGDAKHRAVLCHRCIEGLYESMMSIRNRRTEQGEMSTCDNCGKKVEDGELDYSCFVDVAVCPECAEGFRKERATPTPREGLGDAAWKRFYRAFKWWLKRENYGDTPLDDIHIMRQYDENRDTNPTLREGGKG